MGGKGSLFPRTHYEGKLTPLCLPLRLSATGPSFVWVGRFPCSFVHTTKEKPTPFASPSCDLTTGLSLFWEERWSCSFVPITLEKQTDTHRAALFVYGASSAVAIHCAWIYLNPLSHGVEGLSVSSYTLRRKAHPPLPTPSTFCNWTIIRISRTDIKST